MGLTGLTAVRAAMRVFLRASYGRSLNGSWADPPTTG